MLNRLNIRGKVLATVLCVTLLPRFSMAQYDEVYAEGTHDRWVSTQHRYHTSEGQYSELFYNYTVKDTVNSKFKKVVIRSFDCDDSTYKHTNKDDESERTVSRFNKMGLKTLEKNMDIDSWLSHPVNEKHVMKYDSKGNMTEEIKRRNRYEGKLQTEKHEKWKYDNLGRNTEHEILNNASFYGDPKTEYYWYDSNSNIIHDRTIKYSEHHKADDTIDEYYIFDKDNQEIFELYKGGSTGEVYKYYHKYNDKGQLLWYSENRGTKDSDWTSLSYGPDGKWKETNVYSEGKKKEIYSINPGKNGEKINIHEELSTADLLSCPNNTVTVTTYDSSGNRLSRVATKQEEGHPLVTTAIEKYTRTKGLYIDSTLTKSEGYMYQETWIAVESRKSDDNGNTLEEIQQDGERYQVYDREVNQYNNHNMVTDKKEYDACFTETPATETINTYGPDGVSIQTVTIITAEHIYITDYDQYGRTVRERRKENRISDGKLSSSYYITEYTYTK